MPGELQTLLTNLKYGLCLPVGDQKMLKKSILLNP